MCCGRVTSGTIRKTRIGPIATGSEVAPALDAHARLAADGIGCRVVSMPSWDLFEAQTPAHPRQGRL
jgi:transketolase